MSEHQHRWKMLAHLDACHWYSSAYRCSCGARRETWAERDVSFNSYSAVWMSRDDGEESCERCDALMAGAKPEHRDEIRAGAREQAATNDGEDAERKG